MNTKTIKSKLDKLSVGEKYNPTQAGYWIGKYVTINRDTWDDGLDEVVNQGDYTQEEVNKFLKWVGRGKKVKITAVDIVDETDDASDAYYIFDIPFDMFDIAWNFSSNRLPKEMDDAYYLS